MAFSILPNEVVERLLEYTDVKEWVAMGGTNQRYREVASEDRLWRRDYDRMKHVIGYPQIDAEYRAAAFKPLPAPKKEQIEQMRKALQPSPQNMHFLSSRSDGLVVVGEQRIQGAVGQYAGEFDVYTPGLSQDPYHAFSRMPMMVTRRVNEARGMICSIRLWKRAHYNKDLENLEAGWRERGADIPVIVFTPSRPKKGPHKGVPPRLMSAYYVPEEPEEEAPGGDPKVAQRDLLKDLLQILPEGGFRVQPCEISTGKGLVEGMDWLVKQASKQEKPKDITQQPDFQHAMIHHFQPPQPQPQLVRTDSFGAQRSLSFDMDAPQSPLSPMQPFGLAPSSPFSQLQQAPQMQMPVPKAPKLNTHPSKRSPFQQQQQQQPRFQQLQQQQIHMQQTPQQMHQPMPQQMPRQIPQQMQQMQQMQQPMPQQMQQMPQQMQQMPQMQQMQQMQQMPVQQQL